MKAGYLRIQLRDLDDTANRQKEAREHSRTEFKGKHTVDPYIDVYNMEKSVNDNYNRELCDMTKLTTEITRYIKDEKIQWLGHIMRREDKERTERKLNGNPVKEDLKEGIDRRGKGNLFESQDFWP